MKICDIIKMVCDFVGESEIYSKLPSTESLTKAEQEKVDKMLRCFNLISQEIATDYIPKLNKEEGEFVDKIYFSTLEKRNVIKVEELRNRFGLKMKFKSFEERIEFSGKAKTVIYSFLPDKDFTLTDPFIDRVPAHVYAFGVASEYLLMDGVSEDADIWQEKYKQALFMLTRKRGEHLLPKRTWL